MIRLGSIIAWGLIIFGVMRTAMGFIVAFSSSAEGNAAMSALYLGTANSGDAIDRGMITIIIGVVIGLLVEIAKKKSD